MVHYDFDDIAVSLTGYPTLAHKPSNHGRLFRASTKRTVCLVFIVFSFIRAPNLRLDRVLAGAQKLIDVQMLLDPFEEKIDLQKVL